MPGFNKLNSSLTINSNQFYFDYQDGKYGFNTDPNRGADTFNPFSRSGELDTYAVNGNIVTYTFKNLLAGQRYRIILYKSVASMYGGSTSATGISNVQSITQIAYETLYQNGTFCGIGVYDLIPSASEATVDLSFNNWGPPSYIGISLFY